jgi:N-hydroxyarylamine O-acetyltransferase
MATPNGRITLAGRNFICTRDGNKQERLLGSDEEWRAALKEHFGIVL